MQAHARLGEKVYQDFNYEVSLNTLEHECNPKMNLDYDRWFYSSIAHKNERSYNCSVPFHPPVESSITGKEIEVCEDEEIGKRALSDYNNNFVAGSKTKQTKPCAGMDVFLGPPEGSDQNKKENAYIRIYVKSDVKIKSIILHYDSITLFAELGGYLGMLLGVSLIDCTRFFDYALLKISFRRQN